MKKGILLLILFFTYELCISQDNKSYIYKGNLQRTGEFNSIEFLSKPIDIWTFDLWKVDSLYNYLPKDIFVLDTIVVFSTFCECSGKDMIVSISKKSSKMIWNKRIDSYSFGFVLAVDSDMIIYTEESGVINAINSRNGSQIWQINKVDSLKWKYPIIYNNYVVFASENFLYLASKNNGVLVDSIKLNGFTYDRFSMKDDCLYLKLYRDDKSYIVSFDIKKKKVRWEKEIFGTKEIVVNDNCVFIHINNVKSNSTNKNNYYFNDTINSILALNRHNGKEIWKFEMLDMNGDFTIDKDYLYYFSNHAQYGNYFLYKLDIHNGNQVLKKNFETKSKEFFVVKLDWAGMPIINTANELIFMTSESLINMNKDSGQINWEYKGDFTPYGSNIVADKGILYFSGYGSVKAIK